LKAGLITGFCGSLTSYSSVVFGILMISRKSIFDGISVLIVAVGSSFALFLLGKHFSEMPLKRYNFLMILESRYFSIITAVCCGIIGLIFIILGIRVNWILSLLIGPFGSSSRYLIARYNSIYNHFPIGTFFANTLACILLFAFHMISTENINVLGCDFVNACIVGFCGCLSTVSTFILELDNMPVKESYIYCIISFASAFSFGLIFFGLWSITGHNLESICKI
jgi:fluoride ion exporter CrcB/FEX